MTPVGQADPEYPEKEGQRLDNRDLIQEWVDSKENMNAQYVWNLDDFNGVNPDDTDYLLGESREQTGLKGLDGPQGIREDY